MMQDEVIQKVEATREKIAEHHEYDVKQIAAYLRKRAAERRAVKDKSEFASPPFERAA